MDRRTTGIAELDLVLGGGLPAGALVVLAGGPGTRKTILAQQICFANATPEHRAIYYSTFSEPSVKLVRYLEQFDFFDADALEERVDSSTSRRSCSTRRARNGTASTWWSPRSSGPASSSGRRSS